jgi:hypothetical protein
MVIALPVFIISCSSDDDDKVNNSIVGTWKFKEVTAGEIKTNNTANDGKITSYLVNLAKDDFSGNVYTFSDDGTFSFDDALASYHYSGDYTFKDGKLTLLYGHEDEYDIFNVSIVNGTLIFEENYTEDINDLQLNDLIAIGIGDPVNFNATKTTAKIAFNRQK